MIDEKLAPDNLGAPLGVGDRLKAEREARGLSIENVAQTLKVSRRVLEQVEANAWGGLPGYTFTRGIVRGYAKFVQVDAEPLLQELESAPLLKRPALDLPMSTRAALPVPGQTRNRDRLAMIAGVLMVAGSVMAYFLIPEDWFAGTAAPETPSVVRQVMTESPPVTGSTEPVVAPSSVTLSGTVAEPVGLSMAPIAIPSAAVPPSVAGAAAGVTEGTPILVIKFDEASWVEVKDRNGVMLLSENVVAGSERSVNGQGPMGLALGNADGVRVSFRGQSVDLKPHTRQKVARLALE